ncbi:Bug family tripartite tricarboxylate transporter substrate binding protein [Paucibacter sp. M5-1]|uniref:Bug family tripartite tricarboxylate transporter substrate binding protein n=1 Tax=Paucibacter sp. M5-1 TaxID=3015998 RepID=UPI0022B8A982|nr:tripartite tricarboxylate transporter substrate binding protein [Paucibacter sp. M5-1]MCZ7881841.1 tripartite tricarboxylate transporter substrate binding protein [Paucibacter sp. M5-1]
MSFLNRRALVALAALLAVGGAHADSATDKPLRLILPVGAGSGVDTIIRAVTPALSKALGGQAVVIENLPGAGGITGTAALVKAAPDGLTLGVVSNNHVVNPSVYKKMPFDALNDITPIMVVGATPFVLVVNPAKLPATNVKELVALLKAKPDVYNYASSGNGTILHLGAEMFVDEAGVVMRHIPYKGVGPMVADLIGGQVDLGVLSLPSIQGHLKSGALRAIGVGSAARVPAAPEIPTVAEQGLPNYAIEGWFAVVGPARLPPAQVKRFHAAFTAALAAPEVREAMARQGNVINPTTPEAAASFFRSEQERYAKLVKKAGISLD